MEIFQLGDEAFIELHDLLKVTGLCSTGGMAKLAISEGRVNVDGIIELRKRCKIHKGHVVGFEKREVMVT
jgi:ribosome-associated protein